MKKCISYFLLFTVVLLTYTRSSQGQPREYTTTDKKAIKLYAEGELAHNKRNSELAQLSFQMAVERDPNFIEAHMMLGYVFAELGKKEEAIQSLNTAIAINPNFFPNNFFSVAKLEMEEGKYEDAKKHYQRFLTYPDMYPDLVQEAKTDLINCQFAEKALKNPVPFDPVNMGTAINSDMHEYFPCLTADGEMLLYTRQLNVSGSPSGYNEDFYTSFKKGEQWTKSFNIRLPINTGNNEGAPTLSADGQILVFTACELYGNYGPNRKGFGSCDLFVSQRIGDRWTNPVNLGPPVNTKKWETQPSLAADGKTLYFVRGTVTRGGIKDQDIYMTEIDDEGRWSEPTRLNKNINTKLREESVFIHPDGQTIYFSSNGHPGMGGLDIYLSKKDTSGEWGPAKNLGYPINTSNNENSLLVDAKGQYAYFASNRKGGAGGLDLYYFELPEDLRPELVTYMKGKVYDAVTKKPLYSKFELIDLETGKLAIESWSNKGDGKFLVALPANRNYALNVSKNGYLFYSENFSLKANANAKEPYHKDVPLQPIQVGEKVILKNIFFETAKYDLKPASEVELNKLIDFLTENPNLKIELGGHTDNVGKDEDNQKLSENRAKSVYNYLINHSVDSNRLTYKGFGESQPIQTNDTDAGRAQNRRTEFKIVGNE